MAGKLLANVALRHPQSGEVVILVEGDSPPQWAVKELGGHVYEGAPAADSSEVPPKGGAGSGKEAWAAYAASNDVEVDADATRDDIVAALDKAGVPTE